MLEKNRRIILVGNWKMHKTIAEAKSFIHALAPMIVDSKNSIYLAVPFTAIHASYREAAGFPIVIGAQNMNEEKEGAYTGEISAEMLKEAGAKFVILGHSERRYVYGEGNQVINKKICQALKTGLQPIFCIGETAHERKKGITEEVFKDQIFHGLEGVSADQMKKVIIAYEPIWAIGTGETATPFQAQEMHSFCREQLCKLYGKEVSDRVSILYGGSVKPDNIRALMEQSDVDGALVGGASLDAESFSQIINYQIINV